jgi:hypothetical protein
MSSARLSAFAQRISQTIVQREVAIAHEGNNDHRTMKVHAILLSLLTNFGR